MAETNIDEQAFKKGFNEGYLLAKYKPELMEKLAPSIQPTNEYFEGCLAGKEQHDLEKHKDLSKDTKTLTKEKDHDLDMDIDR